MVSEILIDPAVELPKAKKARKRMEKLLTEFLSTAAESVAGVISKKVKKLAKIDPDDEAKIEYLAAAAYEIIDWQSIVDDVEDELEESADDGASNGFAQLEISDTDMISAVNTIAADFAHERAAEMVGMKWVDGKLVENPDAKWAISETTREDIKDLVEQAFQGETPLTDLVEQIKESATFSEARAEMIARTEVSRAQVLGNVEAWKQTGLVKKVKWQTSLLEPCDICEENEDQEVTLGKPFHTGDEYPPAHPNCRCVLVVGAIGKKKAA